MAKIDAMVVTGCTMKLDTELMKCAPKWNRLSSARKRTHRGGQSHNSQETDRQENTASPRVCPTGRRCARLVERANKRAATRHQCCTNSLENINTHPKYVLRGAFDAHSSYLGRLDIAGSRSAKKTGAIRSTKVEEQCENLKN